MNRSKMRLLLRVLSMALILHGSFAPPVTEMNATREINDAEHPADWEEQLEYHRYLNEVVQALESDSDFKSQLEKTDEEDIRSGKVAEQLDLVHHNVRTRLDEIKRAELSRLRHLATKKFELTNDIADESFKKHNSADHLDHGNPNTFEIEDLKILIKKVSADLEIADKKRKEQFKKYELEKEFQKHQEMSQMDETHKKEYEENMKREEEAKKHHQPLHHPGSKQQYEEVWEKQDHMDQDFDPKVFFMIHDVDGNGVWDADEVKALFVKELNKMYGPDAPVHDIQERSEEMERMREHVFKENDANKDGLIDFHEFMVGTKKQEFNEDKGWETIDHNQEYTQLEYQEFEKMRLEELKYLQQRGLVDLHGNTVPGAMHQVQQARQQFQAYYQQQRTLQHINQYPQQPGQQGIPQFQQPGNQQFQQQGNQQFQQQGNQQFQQQGNQQFQQQGNQQYQQGNQHYQQPPQANQQYQQPQGHQQPPQGNQQYQPPPQVNQQYQQPPQGNQQYQQPPQGNQQYQQPPQGNQQYQQAPQGNQQFQQAPQGNQQFQQPPQGNQQFQQPPQGNQQPPQNKPQVIPEKLPSETVGQPPAPAQANAQTQGKAPGTH